MRRLGSGSMKPRNVVEASSCAEAVSEPTSGDVTPAVDVAQASPATPLSLRDDSPERTSEDPQLSHKQIKGFAGLFLLCTIGFAVSSELVQSNEKRLSRSYSDIFDPGCIDKLGDSGSPGIAQAFNLDLTFGNFTFTQAKIIDVAWDTTIGQGGRLLHGWILYRCVMRRLLIYAMENYHVTCRYYLTVSWSRASFESLCGILKDFLFVQGLTNFYCTILLIYALGYTLLFSLLWSTATGYLSLSHRLYAMPDGNIVPLDTRDLALCWVLDGSRFDSPDDHVEIGPDFSTLDSLAEYFTYTDKTPCINESSSGDIKGTNLSPRRRLVYTSGGWKVNTATTIWDHFGLINGSNNVKNSSENFQSIRAYAITKQLLQISLDPQGWLVNGSQAALRPEVVDQDGIRLDWWANSSGTCMFRDFSGLNPSLDAAQVVSPQATPIPADSQLALEFEVPEQMSWAHFSLGNVSGEALLPGQMPYNSTIWLNGSAISLSAPFVDIGHNCSGNNGFASLGNCVCYKGQPISLELLGEGRAICNTAPGYVWGFSSYLVRLGLAFEATWMACCFTCYLWLSLRSGLVRQKIMRSAGPVKFALEFAEALREIEHAAPELSEDGLMARLDEIDVGYRRPNTLGEHQQLRHRVVAKREERPKDLKNWVDETWRRRKPTDEEVYEDLNWQIYQR
ncbi:hypothetical protein N8I77_012656 [Diaporthe amygdali]|uniref:Uncharacterized protein n=1 Tax=Phomopsis amygdali TaxID=1214568 RepID=A0AAD9S335_PHOAM|nr:hypothetical protein N8I77_012656 [Diaporthe amygdali]